ncbi:MAG: PASTA domain-containing protein [Syntrophorhabdaceae bacterium]|nr:PASTA domain-containing protein [Syntrophorhabdaceae bacterium]
MNIKRVILYFFTGIFVFTATSYLTIAILLKSGETVICPDIKGKNVEEAKKIVEEKGLSLSIAKYERRNDIPYNHITVQKPQANISIRKGRVVYVMVSEGPELIKIPNVKGKEIKEAEEVLYKVKARIERVIPVPNNRMKGIILAQIPNEGETVLEGKQGLTVFVAVPEVSYYVLPEIDLRNINEIIYELERRGIKYRLSSIRSGDTSYGMPYVETSKLPKTIIRDSEEVEIRIDGGG